MAMERECAFRCTECGDTQTLDDVEMCEFGDCLEYVCKNCGDRFCEEHKEEAEDDE